MTNPSSIQRLLCLLRLVLVTAIIQILSLSQASAQTSPAPGALAPNFTLKTLDEVPIELHKLTSRHPVVLVVLRGWPGYQCPLCERQVHDLVQHASKLKERGVQLLFVYPGLGNELKKHSQDFLRNKDWPQDFLFVLDPDYSFTTTYGLRWDAPKETAYPASFIIDSGNKVRFAKISKSHGGRVSASELLRELDQLK